jgi:hypothetical protein
MGQQLLMFRKALVHSSSGLRSQNRLLDPENKAVGSSKTPRTSYLLTERRITKDIHLQTNMSFCENVGYLRGYVTTKEKI